MRRLLMCTAYLLLVFHSNCVKMTHLSGDLDDFLTILNAMMAQNKLPYTKQISHCFTPQQAGDLKLVINRLTATAAAAGTVELKNFPNYYLTYTKSQLSNDSLACVYSSRDFGLLMRSFTVDFGEMGAAFSKQVDKNFIAMHKSFSQLKILLDNNLYLEYGKQLNQMFQSYFGKRIQTEKEWEKKITNLENYDPNQYFGISVSNGVIGAVSSIRPLKVAKTVLAGAYDVFGRGRVDNIVQTFPALQLVVEFGNQQITSRGYYNYQQVIDIKNGEFSGAFSAQRCSVKYTYWALKNLPFAFYTSVEIVAHETSHLLVQMEHEAPEYLNDIQKSYQNLEEHKYFSIMHTKATTKTGKMDLIVASSFLQDDDQDYKYTHEDRDSNKHILKTRINVTKGHSYKFGFITALISTAHHEDPQNEAIRIVQRAVLIGEKPLIEAHRRMWNQMWKNDIIIEGHQQDQKNVRLMLYHCYAFINEFKSYGISPMGLSGLGYNGHVFWDMDLWIYPGILGLNPNLAKTLIEYRFERLEAARNNAFINGYKGAMYPWESSRLGVEQTPVWALSGPLQHHISGCVAVATWNYFAVTQDIDWLKTKGFQILSSVAEFWQSRVQLGEDGLYHIKNVVAADEWAENVDDNAFTNAVAKESFRLYNLASKRLGLAQNDRYKQIGNKIIILKLPNGVTKEHNRYNGQNIKQADVNLLSFPLKTITDTDQIMKDLNYYKDKIPNDGTPAMTYGVFTTIYSRLLDSDNAYKYFITSHKDYLKPPFNVFAEVKFGDNPYFLTGAGGVIQSVVFGFGGYDITENGLKKINTAIPKQWKSVTIKGFMQCGEAGCSNSYKN